MAPGMGATALRQIFGQYFGQYPKPLSWVAAAILVVFVDGVDKTGPFISKPG